MDFLKRGRSCVILFLLLLVLPCIVMAQWVDPDSLTSIAQLKKEFNNNEGEIESGPVAIAGIANTASGRLHEVYLQTYLQTDSSGISIFSYSIEAPVLPGDSVVVKGIKQMYFGQSELLVEEYRVYPDDKWPAAPNNIFEAIRTPQKYTGMLVEGTAVIKEKGNRFNGKYLIVAPNDTSRQTVMIYVSNFHSLYQDFDFATPSIGDVVSITGVLGQFDAADPENLTYKVFLRTPDDFSYEGWPQYYFKVIAMIFGLLIVIAVSWMILLKRQVHQKTVALQQSLTDKEILLKEIHHRVKNNLAGISGLLELQSGTTESQEVREALQESQTRITSMMMVHQKLYQSVTLKEISMKEYLEDLSANIRHTFAAGSSQIEILVNADEIAMNTDRVIPLGLLVNELLVNAFKHAFAQNEKGTILVDLKKRDGELTLKVEDNGVGLPDDLEPNESDSLGMLLIKTFAEQLKAQKKVKNTPGACFIFKFPRYQ